MRRIWRRCTRSSRRSHRSSRRRSRSMTWSRLPRASPPRRKRSAPSALGMTMPRWSGSTPRSCASRARWCRSTTRRATASATTPRCRSRLGRHCKSCASLPAPSRIRTPPGSSPSRRAARATACATRSMKPARGWPRREDSLEDACRWANMTELPPLEDAVLPAGIRSRFLDGINGLRMHVLEAGFETAGRPCVLLLHGFPELAYSWRKVMPALAAAGFHVVAPDQRGYGRTTGWDGDYDDDLNPFRLLNLVRDALGLVSAFGYRSIDAVIGHDFGSPVAAWSALVRPDVFRSVVMMSAPFGGPPRIPLNTANAPARPASEDPVHHALAALPRPRKHYQWYYSTRQAND